MLRRERQIGQHIVLTVGQHHCRLWPALLHGPHHFCDLRLGRLLIPLGEDGAHRRRHHGLVAMGHVGQDVAHEVHPAPLPGCAGQHAGDGFLKSQVSIADHQSHPFQATSHQTPQKGHPEAGFLTGADVHAQDLPLARLPDTNGNDHRHAHDAMVLTHLDVQRIQPQVGIAGFQRPVAEGGHHLVQVPAQAGDLALVHAAQPQALDQLVDLARADAGDVGLLDNGHQGLLCSPSGLQEARVVDSLPQLGNAQRDLSDARLPGALPETVALRDAFRATLVTFSADLFADLQFHEELGQQSDAFPQEVAIEFDAHLAQVVTQCYNWFGH